MSARAIDVDLTEIVRLCQPPPQQTVSQWADANRLLPESSAARGGRYRTSDVEYLREIMDSGFAPGISRVAVMKSHQVGASEALYNLIAFAMVHRPSPLLLIMPTADAGQQVAKERLGDLIRSCVAVRKVVQNQRHAGPLAPPESTLNLILFRGGFLSIGGANTPNSFARVAARIGIGDDVDRFPPTVGAEGDPGDLLQNRVTTFHDGRTLMVSTPTLKGGRIDALYAQSDQRRFHLTCPACQRADWITWSDPAHWWVQFDDRNPATARLTCAGCGHAVREPDRMRLVRAGVWRPTATTAPAGLRGYHVPSALSPFITLPNLVGRFLEATQRGREALRTFVNTSLAEAWEDPDERIRVEPEGGFMSRREAYKQVPHGASWITGAIDVQEDRFEALFVAWGRREEMWVLAHEVLARDEGFDPFESKSWDSLSLALERLTFEHTSGRQLPCQTICVDSGFQTQLAYRFSRMNRSRIFCTKGMATLQEGHFIKFSEDRDTATRLRRGVTLVLVDTNVGKQRIHDRTRDGRIHFPVADWCSEEFFAQLSAEVAEPILNPAGIRVGQKWIRQRPRNEILDLLVLNLAAKAIRGTVDLDGYRQQIGLPAVDEA